MRGKRANFCSNELENCAARAYNVRIARVHDTHVHVYARNARICTSAYVCTHTCARMHACMHACMCTYVCAHMLTRMRVTLAYVTYERYDCYDSSNRSFI